MQPDSVRSRSVTHYFLEGRVARIVGDCYLIVLRNSTSSRGVISAFTR